MASDSLTQKIPNLTLAQSLFTLRSQPPSSSLYTTAREHLLKEIQENSLAPLYQLLKDDLPDWSESTYDALKAKNDEEEKALEDKLQEAEQMNGESEVSAALIAKFMFLARILDKVCKSQSSHR
jgi:26S proteasome regulatory subunit N7